MPVTWRCETDKIGFLRNVVPWLRCCRCLRAMDAAGVSSTTISIGAEGGVIAGETKRYQCWYRNQSTPAGGLGVNEFNLSNGYEVLWLP